MVHNGELALVNANVRTMDADGTVAEALLVRNGKIIAVGTSAEIRARASSGTEITDALGRTVVPGFVDSHNHLSIAAFAPVALNCADPELVDIPSLLTAVEQRVTGLPPGQWVMGYGVFGALLVEGRNPTRFELDEVSPNNPVMLLDLSCHAAVANSSALARVGITSHTPQPWGGEIVKNHAGEPTGQLLEAAMNLVLSAAWGAHAERDWDIAVGLLEAKMKEYLALGITGIGDALVTSRFHELYRRAETGNRLPLTVQQLHGGDHFFSQQDFTRRGLAERILGTESDRLRGGAMKIFADRGFPGPAIDEIHDGCTRHTGASFYSADEVKELAVQADALGITPVIHTIGNCAMDFTLDAYEAVRLAGSDRLLRMEHAFIGDRKQPARMAELGVDLVANPGLIHHTGEVFSTWRGEGQSHLTVLPIRSMLDAGVRVSLASDHPCGPVAPAEIMSAAVTRTTAHGFVVDAEEAITTLEALRMYTIDAAAASGREKEEGSLEVGKRANILLLDRDPGTASGESLLDLTVERTFVDGRLVYSTGS